VFVPFTASRGTGPPLLMLHGFGADCYTWRHLVPPLSRRYRTIALDLKGFGHSPKPADQAYSIHDQAEIVMDFIRSHDLRRLTLVGHSLGGGVALATAVRLVATMPGWLTALVLIDTIAYPQPVPWFILLLRLPFIRQVVVFAPRKLQAALVLRYAYHRPAKISWDDINAYAAPLAQPGARHALLATADQLVPPEGDALVEAYRSISVPALLLFGAHDRIVPSWVGTRLHAALPASQLVVVPDAGHIPHEETPDAVVPVVEGFLGDVYRQEQV
jgi:pimeloyl-ACP methyl ester carboxylesterase